MDGVAADTVFAELHGGRLGHGADRALGGGVAHLHHGLAHIAADRGQVDDRSAAILLHLPDRGGGAEEDPGGVNRHDAVPQARIQHVVGGAAADAGVVHQDVEAAVDTHRLLDELLPAGFVGDVEDEEHSIATGGVDAVGDLVALLGQHVGDDDLGTLLGEAAGGGRTHAR